MRLGKKLKRMISGAVAMAMMLSAAPLSDVATLKASAETRTELPITGDVIICNAAKGLGFGYAWGQKGVTNPYGGLYNWGQCKSQSQAIQTGLDCSGFVNWVLTMSCLATDGFGNNSPTPVDTGDWLVRSNGQWHENGDSVNWWKRADANSNTRQGDISTVTLNSMRHKITDGSYWLDANGNELNPGAVIIATENKNSLGGSGTPDHAWIYLGEFDTRDDVIDYVNSVSGVSKDVIAKYTSDGTGDGGKHWRIEETTGYIINGEGVSKSSSVLIDNGTQLKTNSSQYYASAFNVEKGDSEYSFRKVDKDTNKVLVSYTSPTDVSSAGVAERTFFTWAIYSDYNEAKNASYDESTKKPTGNPVEWGRADDINDYKTWSFKFPSAKTYYLVELEPPTGYKVNHEVVTLKPDETVDIADDRYTGSMSLKKVVTGDCAGKFNGTVTVMIHTMSNNTWNVDKSTLFTRPVTIPIKNGVGTITINDLPVYGLCANNGAYTPKKLVYSVTEMSCKPDKGYENCLISLDTTPKTICLADCDNFHYEASVDGDFKNEIDIPSVVVTKQFKDEDGKTISFGTAQEQDTDIENLEINFTLYKANADDTPDYSNAVVATNESGSKYTFSKFAEGVDSATKFPVKKLSVRFTLEGLPAGRYVLHEETNSSIFAAAEDKAFTVDGEEKFNVVNNKKITDVVLEKEYQPVGTDAFTDEQLATLYSQTKFTASRKGTNKDSNATWSDNYIQADATSESGIYTFRSWTSDETEATKFVVGNDIDSDYFGKIKINGIPLASTSDETTKYTIQWSEIEVPECSGLSHRVTNSKADANGTYAIAHVTNNIFSFTPSIIKTADDEPLATETSSIITDSAILYRRLSSDRARAIGGATYGLYADEDIVFLGKTLWSKDELISTVVTKDGVEAYFNVKLPLESENGYTYHYYIQELTAPDGYYLNPTKYSVTYLYNSFTGSAPTHTVDEEISAFVYKNGTEQELIAGAEMQLLDLDGNVLESWTTVANETHKIEATLTPGVTYKIHEVKAPTGYYPTDDITFTVPTEKPTDNNGAIDIVVVDKEINAKIYKSGYNAMTLEYTENLEGATLQLIDKSGKVVDEWVSSADGGHVVPHNVLVAGETYTIHEVSAPTGYFLAKDIKVQVPAEDTGKTLEARVVDDYITIELFKTSAVTTESLEGATMRLTDKVSGEVIDEWVSTGKQHLVHDGIVAGRTYIYEEVKAPDGYIVSTEKIEITVPKTYKALSATIVNEPTQLSVYKVSDTKTGVATPIVGAVIAVIDKTNNKEIDRWTTDGTEHVIKGKLVAGRTYIVREISVPDGYIKADDIEITISSDGSVDTVEMVDNKMFVDIYKTNADGEALKGATLVVYDKTTLAQIDNWTSNGEPHRLAKGIVAGHQYVLSETNPPKGYTVSPDVEFTFDANGKIVLSNTYDEAEWVTYEVANADEANKLNLIDAKTEWEFTKTDKNGKPLPDCEFELVDSNGTVIKEWVSDENTFKVVGELDAGLEYTVREKSAKDGYVLAADITFTVKGITSDEYGMVTITKMVDTPTHVVFSKRDLTNQEELPGAVMVVYDQNGNEIDRWVSGATPHEVIAEYIAGATYTIHEEVAPSGYIYALDQDFKVSEDGSIDEVIVNDDYTKLSILKRDIDTHEPVVGAHMSLYKTADLESENATPILTWTTTDTAKRIDKLVDVGTSYTIIETYAPDGYVIMNKYNFTIPKDYDGHVINIYLNDDYTKAEFEKTDITTGEVVIGAVLRIEDMDGNLIDEWTTDGTPHTLNKVLVAGETYKLIETFAPDGYVISEEIIFTVNDDGSITHVEMKDDYTKVEITKVGKDTNGIVSPLAGARLQVLDEDGNVIDEWVSNGDIHPLYKKLVAGKTYYIHEVEAPFGYSLAPEDKQFTVSEDGSVDSVEVVDATTAVRITKYGENSQEVKTPLAGAVLQVIDPSVVDETTEEGTSEASLGKVVYEWTTDESGSILLESVLEQGKTYILHEASVPTGYVKADDIEFTVPVTGQVVEVEMVDKTTKVTVQKFDEDGNVLEGATLQLVDMNGNVVEEWQSDAEWYMIEGELEEGLKYTIHEKEAPEGYILSADIEVSVSLDGSIDEYSMVDKYTKVKFSKKSMTGEDELPGAVMVVYDSEGNEVERWTSTTDPHYVIAKYIAGEIYRLHEEVSPTGYVLASDIDFTVSEDGSVDTVVMNDDTTKVAIDKLSVVDGKYVIGAKLNITDLDGNVVVEWVTDGKTHLIDGVLEAGKTYVLNEVYAPAGYVIAKSKEFTVLETGDILKITLEDEITRVSVYKKDADSKADLAGAVLQVIDKDGNVVEEWTTDGKVHEINNKLVAGETYTLHEKSAPDGYLTSDDIKFTVNADGSVTEVTMLDAKKPVTDTPSTGGDAPTKDTNADNNANNGVVDVVCNVENNAVKDVAEGTTTTSTVPAVAFGGFTFVVVFFVAFRRRRKAKASK